MNSRPRLSVVIPTHNGAVTLAGCLQSLRSCSLPPHEIIVVDDASTDGSAEIARRLGCCVLRLEENVGAARAKNRGAKAATGDALFFTDDDVVVSKDALTWIAEDLGRADGVVGLLDDDLPFRDFATQYKNLWMRFTYSRLPRERIGVFYTSVAAIHRQVFFDLGGFDEHYVGASVAEDTEFGQRAWAAGARLILDPRVLVKHFKSYTPWQVLKTDFWRARALTLMRLRKWGQPFFTSVPRFYAWAVAALFAALACWLVAALWQLPAVALIGALALIGFYVLNGAWLGFLARERGARFAALASLMQPLDTVAVAAGMLWAALDSVRGRRY